MKNIVSATLCMTLLFLGGAAVFAEIGIPFFGNNNFTIDADTTFAADANDGSTGLATEVGIGIWFEFIPYADRNITPQRDVLSVSLKLANSAFYAWRGYSLFDDAGNKLINDDQVPSDVTIDQATSLWFDAFLAQLEYNKYWVRIAGTEPEVSISQASIRSVFDPIFANRTAIDKNRMYLPFFHSAAHYRPWPNHGIVSIIGRDLVHLNRREVAIAGNLSAGMKTEILDLTLKGGSWKTAEQNNKHSWVGGGDIAWRPDLSQSINFSLLAAVNYGTIDLSNDIDKNDPMQNPNALVENPLALGLGYEYRISLLNRMIIKPYAGIDFIYDTKSNDYNYEIGGGLQWYFRGSGAMFKRNTKIAGAQIGDVEIPAALIMGANINRDGLCNAIISFNEDPRSSPLPRLGGFLLAEFMNINGKKYLAPDNKEYNDFLLAGMIQIEYLLHDKVMPYIFAQYVPAKMPASLRDEDPVFDKNYKTITSKLGCRFSPVNYFSVDLWYERTDVRIGNDWTTDNGLVSICFSVRNYF